MVDIVVIKIFYLTFRSHAKLQRIDFTMIILHRKQVSFTTTFSKTWYLKTYPTSDQSVFTRTFICHIASEFKNLYKKEAKQIID